MESYPLSNTPGTHAYPRPDQYSSRVYAMEEDLAESSPNSADTGNSSTPPHAHRSSSRGSESVEYEDEKESSSVGKHRSRSVSSTKSEREKRKRSRVTPEQLVHLERFFAIDRSPTAVRRREISGLLGMQERQTQIWFQNRRAKAKLLDGKQKGRSGITEVPPDSPPELSTGFEIDLHNLIHEDEPVTIIPCTDLSIGSWRRIATTMGKHDLVAYVCDVKRCLTWFIQSDGFGFKMEIPFETITSTEFTNAAPGSGLASFLLSKPPLFYLEYASSPRADGSTPRHWKQCNDWTEGHQASEVLRHELIGSAVQLAHLLKNLQASKAGSDIPLHSPAYRTDPARVSPIQLSPLMGGIGYQYPTDTKVSLLPEQRGLSRQHSFPGQQTTYSPDLEYLDDVDIFPPPRSAPAGFTQTEYTMKFDKMSSSSSSSPSGFNKSAAYAEYEQNVAEHSQLLDKYMPISLGSGSQSYTAQPIPRNYYNSVPDVIQMFKTEDTETHTSLGMSHHYPQESSGPPLLTTPYHPRPHPPPEDHSRYMTSAPGYPGVVYESTNGPPRPFRNG